MPRDEELRDRLAKPTLQRIRADRDGVHLRLRPLLDTIARRLFDSDFSVKALWSEHDLPRTASAWFFELGTTPAVYIAEARYEVARLLLSETDMRIWRMAQLLGYSERAFERGFEKRCGCPPQTYRDRGEPRRTLVFDAKLVESVVDLTPAESAKLVADLEDAVTRVRTFSCLGGAPEVARASELAYVEATIWPRLAGLRFKEQRELVRLCRPFTTSAFFDFLHRKSRAEGRRDRQRGIALARLAVDTLVVNKTFLEDLFDVLCPQAHAWVGNARRLDLDFLGADREIRTALKKLRQTSDPFAQGIVYLCQGTLRMFQRRHDEAIAAFDVALPAFEEADSNTWKINTLLHRSSALQYSGRLAESLQPLAEAKRSLSAENEALRFLVTFSMINILAEAKNFSKAQTLMLEELRLPGTGSPPCRHQVEWLEACIAQGLEKVELAKVKYRSAADGMMAINEPVYAAFILLDLAILYSEAGEREKVIAICDVVYSTFASLRLSTETMASIQLLDVTSRKITMAKLQTVRTALRRDPLADAEIGRAR